MIEHDDDDRVVLTMEEGKKSARESSKFIACRLREFGEHIIDT